MTLHATIILDSGMFFQNIKKGEEYGKLEVGFFGSGDDTTDIQVIADGIGVGARERKLGTGNIEVLLKKADGSNGKIEITDAFLNTLLRLEDLYPINERPDFDRTKFDCTFVFTSGQFCCSMAKVRRFVEYSLDNGAKTGKDLKTGKPISHNVAVHYELEQGDILQLVKSNNTLLFTTEDLKPGTKRVDIDVVADNSTAEKFYKYVFTHKGRTCWLPNQGDPPTVGLP